MSAGPIRRLARLVGASLERVYPPDRSNWARAMRYEIDQVDKDGAAFLFALGCLWGGCRQSATQRLSNLTQGAATMVESGKLWQPRNLGVACAVAATCLGILYLIAAGAPVRYLVVNAVALVLGLVAFRGLAGAGRQSGRFTGFVILALGACLLATALLAGPAEGATRWLWIGPLSVQVSLVFLPPMIVAFARQSDAIGTAGIAVAALALALQPDRAMAGALAFGTAILAVTKPSRFSLAALLAAAAAFVVTILRPDALPAVAYVDQILFTAFDVHMLAGAAVLLGSLLLPLPALAGWNGGVMERPAHLVFGSVWLACVLAAVLGNYPTPIVGYGGSAILGYLLSLSALPTRVQAARGSSASADGEASPLSGSTRYALLT